MVGSKRSQGCQAQSAVARNGTGPVRTFLFTLLFWCASKRGLQRSSGPFPDPDTLSSAGVSRGALHRPCSVPHAVRVLRSPHPRGTAIAFAAIIINPKLLPLAVWSPGCHPPVGAPVYWSRSKVLFFQFHERSGQVKGHSTAGDSPSPFTSSLCVGTAGPGTCPISRTTPLVLNSDNHCQGGGGRITAPLLLKRAQCSVPLSESWPPLWGGKGFDGGLQQGRAGGIELEGMGMGKAVQPG